MTDITISPEQVESYSGVLQRAVSQVGGQLGMPTDPATGAVEQVPASTLMNALMMDVVTAAVPALAANVQLIAMKVLTGALQASLASADAQARVTALQQDQAQASSDGLISGTMSDPATSTTTTDAYGNVVVIGGGVPAGLESLANPPQAQSVTVIGGEGFSVGGGGGGLSLAGGSSTIGLQLQEMLNQSNFDATETWLAPDGTDYLGESSGGDMMFEDSAGNIGNSGQMYTNDAGTTSIDS